MTLISRYIFREALGSTIMVMGVLLVILMSNQFAEILGDAAADALPRDAVFSVFGLSFLRYITLLAPISLLLGVMLALARLNRDSEMAALSACGIGPARLLKPIGLLAVLAAVGIAWVALVTAPAASRAIELIKFDAREEMELSALTPGSFTTTDSGRTVLYARDMQGDQLQGVFLQREQGDSVVVVLAEGGERVQNTETGEFILRLSNGRRYEGVPGEADFFVAEFREHGMPIRLEQEEFVERIDTKPTALLLASGDRLDRAELQWRISAPLSMILLVLLAVPLSRSSPREGRYARVGVGLLFYITYANSLSIARVWMERGLAPEWLGVWWVHVAVGVLAMALLLRQSGTFAGALRQSSPRAVRYEPTA